MATAIMAVPTVIGALLVAPVWAAGSSRRMRALTSWLGAEHPRTPVWRLGALAAWPQQSGHGTALVDQLLTPRGGVVNESFVVAWPRSTELRDWYRRRFGMREHADGGLYLPPRGRE